MTRATPRLRDVYTQAFREWFGDSVVMDAQGNALVVYHGTNDGGFVEFEGAEGPRSGGGIFFSTSYALASSYTRGWHEDPTPPWEPDEYLEGGQAGVYEVHLRIEDPLIVDAREANWDMIHAEMTNRDGESVGEFGGSTGYLVREAREMGFDGVIIRNVTDYGAYGDGLPADVYVVFDPNQIKSVKHNMGTFSRQSDDIRKNAPAGNRGALPGEFPRDLAEQVRLQYPHLWAKHGTGGNPPTAWTGDDAYRAWGWLIDLREGRQPPTSESPAAKRAYELLTGQRWSGPPSDLFEAVTTLWRAKRERYISRHAKDFRPGGTIAMIKWGGIFPWAEAAAPGRGHIPMVAALDAPRANGPVLMYRGTQGTTPGATKFKIPSFTPCLDAATIYAAIPGDDWGRRKARFLETSTVHAAFIDASPVLRLGGNEPQANLGDVLRDLNFGQPGGIQREEVVRIYNYLHNRALGRTAGGTFKYQVFDDEGTLLDLEDDNLVPFSISRPETIFSVFRESFDWSRDHEILVEASGLVADAFVFADTPAVVRAAQRLGFRGISYMDVFEGAEAAAPVLLACEAEDIEGLEELSDLEGDLVLCHETLRPLPGAEVTYVWHRPAESLMDNPPPLPASPDEPRSNPSGEEPEPLVLWHGAQRWEGPPQLRPAGKRHSEHGSGLYLTTSATTAARYARGGGSVMRFEVEPTLRWSDDVRIRFEEMEAFARSHAGLRHRQAVLADLVRRQQRTGSDTAPAVVLENLLYNNGSLSGSVGPALAEWFVAHGVDARHVPQSGEDWLVLYNLDKIREYRKVPAREAVDSPRLRERENVPQAAAATFPADFAPNYYPDVPPTAWTRLDVENLVKAGIEYGVPPPFFIEHVPPRGRLEIDVWGGEGPDYFNTWQATPRDGGYLVEGPG